MGLSTVSRAEVDGLDEAIRDITAARDAIARFVQTPVGMNTTPPDTGRALYIEVLGTRRAATSLRTIAFARLREFWSPDQGR